MFPQNSIIKVIVPNVINNGYDYRLNESASVGDIVSIPLMNKTHPGLIIGAGDANIPDEKIKSVLAVHGQLPGTTVEWIRRMSDWTMMPMGAIWKLMSGAADFSKCGVWSVECGIGDRKNCSTMTTNPPIVETSTNSTLHTPHSTLYRDTGTVTLAPEQAAAAAAIKLDGFAVHLLDGITGSGKTQVYFDAVWRAFASGKSVLLMMPEIALTAQFMTRFKNRFGAKPVEWHSNLTPARRRKIWHGVLNKEIKIVVGTRSALFLPWQDLGLIVIDEEHDGSYKQEEMGNYHARDMGILLAKISNIPVVLASATPSFETIRNVQTGKYSSSKLTSRFGGAILPKVEIVDMRKK